MTNQTPTMSKPNTEQVIELSEVALKHVAGGINPQPLPPRAPSFRD